MQKSLRRKLQIIKSENTMRSRLIGGTLGGYISRMVYINEKGIVVFYPAYYQIFKTTLSHGK